LKTAAAMGAGLLLVGGITGTLAFVKWEEADASRVASNGDAEAWRHPTNSFAMIEQAAPQVRILPTKFPNSFNNLKGNASGLKWVGIGTPITTIAWVAYDAHPARVLFETPPPNAKYDFITSLPEGSLEGLQQELKRTLGFVGHRETRETDVLVLRVQNPNAPGLRPGTMGGTQNWGQGGRYYCDDVPLSSTNRALQGLTQFLEQSFKMPVLDETGLSQTFNIDLRWNARHARPREAIREALLNQLGLELAASREPVEMLVMEKAR